MDKIYDECLTFMHAFQSDEVAKKATSRREKLNVVKEYVDFFACVKNHQKKKCAYKCRYCGNRISSKCFKQFPELMHRHRSRSTSRSRRKFDTRKEGEKR